MPAMTKQQNDNETKIVIPATHRARRLCGDITGDCPVGGCGRAATAWGAPALVDGYVDACSRHAQDAVLDAIEDQESGAL